jgi:hypothetical protein
MRRQLSRGSKAQFSENVCAVLANREFGYFQRACDAPAIHRPTDEQQYFAFPPGKTRHGTIDSSPSRMSGL